VAQAGGAAPMRGGVTTNAVSVSAGANGVSNRSFLSSQSLASVSFLSSSPTQR
jgi:hypothetical protein